MPLIVGTWRVSGSVPQDTASWYRELTITGDDAGLGGTCAWWIEGWSPETGHSGRENEHEVRVSGRLLADGTAQLVVDDHVLVARLSAGLLVVEATRGDARFDGAYRPAAVR